MEKFKERIWEKVQRENMTKYKSSRLQGSRGLATHCTADATLSSLSYWDLESQQKLNKDDRLQPKKLKLREHEPCVNCNVVVV